MEIFVPTPPDFSFKRTVLSHGWSGLLPFELDRENWTLTRVLDIDAHAPVVLRITDALTQELRVAVDRSRLSKRASLQISRDVRHIFRLDDDMSGFYQLASRSPEFAWIAREGAGRLLRAPTVYEELLLGNHGQDDRHFSEQPGTRSEEQQARISNSTGNGGC